MKITLANKRTAVLEQVWTTLVVKIAFQRVPTSCRAPLRSYNRTSYMITAPAVSLTGFEQLPQMVQYIESDSLRWGSGPSVGSNMRQSHAGTTREPPHQRLQSQTMNLRVDYLRSSLLSAGHRHREGALRGIAGCEIWRWQCVSFASVGHQRRRRLQKGRIE